MPVRLRRHEAHRFKRRTLTFATWLMWIGVSVLGVGGYAAWQGWQTLYWPKVEATVISSAIEIDTTTRTVPLDDKYRGGETETRERMSAKIRYRYVVDSVPFESSRIEPYDLGLPSAGAIRGLEDRASEGARVEIAYDPRDPRRAYLVPGPSGSAISLMVIGAVLMALGLVIGKLTHRA